MMRRTVGWIVLALLATSGLLAAEPGGWKARSVTQRPTGPGPSAPAPNAIADDPIGDTFGGGLYRPDLIEVEAQFDTDSLGDPAGSADVLFSSHGIAITVPFAAIGFDDGVVDVVAALGSIDGGFGEATDCAPDGAVLASTLVPVELLSLSVE